MWRSVIVKSFKKYRTYTEIQLFFIYHIQIWLNVAAIYVDHILCMCILMCIACTSENKMSAGIVLCYVSTWRGAGQLQDKP